MNSKPSLFSAVAAILLSIVTVGSAVGPAAVANAAQPAVSRNA